MDRFIIFSLIVLSISDADAAIYKGQKEFAKRCSMCHTGGHSFIAKKSAVEWQEYMKNSGEELIKVHSNISDAKIRDSYDYFRNSKPEKNSGHLLQFLIEYSKDSGKVPACN